MRYVFMPAVTITSEDVNHLFWRLVFIEAIDPSSTTEILSTDEESGIVTARIVQ
tara:strand:+ start:364 stop:525 length:162 start_codon:yes stop_codon:yes gene_type:complete